MNPEDIELETAEDGRYAFVWGHADTRSFLSAARLVFEETLGVVLPANTEARVGFVTRGTFDFHAMKKRGDIAVTWVFLPWSEDE